jgi:hypothetical protein
MAYFESGNTPIQSTSAPLGSDPSTSTLLAEIDSTQLAGTLPGGQNYQITAIVGASTNAQWLIEQCLSTGLGSTAIRTLTSILTPTAMSGQYTWKWKLEQGDRIRARVNSSFTAVTSVKLFAEPLV